MAIKRTSLNREPQCTDPMERLIEEALISAGIPFQSEMDKGGSGLCLDFYIPDLGVAIEVKRFFSPRSNDQLGRAENVILVQGEKSVRTLAAMIKGHV